jgi:hypothetical protein
MGYRREAATCGTGDGPKNGAEHPDEHGSTRPTPWPRTPMQIGTRQTRRRPSNGQADTTRARSPLRPAKLRVSQELPSQFSRRLNRRTTNCTPPIRKEHRS